MCTNMIVVPSSSTDIPNGHVGNGNVVHDDDTQVHTIVYCISKIKQKKTITFAILQQFVYYTSGGRQRERDQGVGIRQIDGIRNHPK